MNRGNRTGSEFTISDESDHLSDVTVNILPLEEIEKMLQEIGFTVENLELFEFTENNRVTRNSWWHFTLLKEKK